MKELQNNLKFLFERELDRLSEEIKHYSSDEKMLSVSPGITNSAANLSLHLIGNLYHFIGHQLGGNNYQRDRNAEFNRKDITKEELLKKLDDLKMVIKKVLESISDEALGQVHDPKFTSGETFTIQQFLIHLHGHLSYHLGQINYHRRLLDRTEG